MAQPGPVGPARAGFALAGLWLLAVALPAQADEAELRAALLRAFRGVESPAAQGFDGYPALLAELERLRGLLAPLSDERQRQTRFWIDVRRADVLLRERELQRAADVLLPALAEARANGVWAASRRGGYRATALVLLEQCLPADRFVRLLAEEAEYLESGRALEDAPWLALPLALVRTELALQQSRDRDGMRLLQDAVDDAIRTLPVDDPWRTKAVARLAWECLVRSDLERAEVYLRALPEELQRYPRGVVALRRGDLELAERAARALVRQGRHVEGGQLLGEVCERAGRIDEARVAYLDVLQHAREGLDRGVAQRSLGDCEVAAYRVDRVAERLAGAQQHYEAALASFGGGPHAATEEVQVLARLGELAELRGDPDRALLRFRESLARVDTTRGALAADLFGGFWLADGQLAAVDGVLRLATVGRVPVTEAFAAVEVGLARTLLDWTERAPQRNPEVAQAVVALVLDTRALGLDARRERLEAARRRSGSEVVARVEPLAAAAITAQLDAAPAAAVVVWWAGATEVFALWRGPGDAGGVAVLGARDVALAELGAARQAVESPPAAAADGSPWPALAVAAARFLPPPLRDRVRASTRVVALTSASLGGLPVEALPLDPERPAATALGRVVAVERAPSLSVRARLLARHGAGSGVALVDSVRDPATEQSLGLAPLRFAEREAELVEQAYPGRVTRLSAAAATLAGLDALLKSGPFDLVHVSTHAVEDRRVPTASLLVLADGPAALPALCSLDLRGAFVVLSACSTASGEERSGEGELALVGWPCAAGGRGAVASLWPVNQQATADLLGQFHHFRAAGCEEAEAMRRARDALAAAPQYEHPYYWAGFAAYAPVAAAGEAELPWWSLGLGLAGGLLALVVWRARGLRHRDATRPPGSAGS
ncbi:MAG: CHAT domain-containing protein [Planctomycetes bacterium]|nr:CHAT domain-containing protein [Planctomycetota bacterium]